MRDEPPDDDEKRRALLAGLSERERRVLRERFGIDPDGESSLRDVLEQFEATRARIAAIEAAVARQRGPGTGDSPAADDPAPPQAAPPTRFVSPPPCANDSDFAATDGPQNPDPPV